jgi:hypothetical protein
MKVFEFLLITLQWLSKNENYWDASDTRMKEEAQENIKAFIEFLTAKFQRSSQQNWNISKVHELLHIPSLISLFGSPANYDSAACEQMHKDFAKQPGRKSQKRNETFDQQAASRLAQRYIIDTSMNVIQKSMSYATESTNMSDTMKVASASHFFVNFQIVATSGRHGKKQVKVTTSGEGSLKLFASFNSIYPDLVEFIAYKFSLNQNDGVVRCVTEYATDSNILYRCHPNYQRGGYWHDWAWVRFADKTKEGLVPAKLLTFIPDGIPGIDEECHVICHPCQWKSKFVTNLLDQWILEPCKEQINNGIPYEIVPISALSGHCLIIPDLEVAGRVLNVKPIKEWATLFLSIKNIFK